MERNKNKRKMSYGRIIKIEEIDNPDEWVYDLEIEKTHNYIANGILVSNSASQSYLKVNRFLKNAFFKYGLTGSFIRPAGDEMYMHGVLSNVIYKKTASELIREGWIARPHITILRHKLTGWSKLNYADAYNKITSDVEFNTIVTKIAEKEMNLGRQVLVLVRRREHGEYLSNAIEGSVYLNGDDSEEKRELIKYRFSKKEVKCLIATAIFGEGQSIDQIDVLINARAHKSDIMSIQGVGRALRKAANKDIAFIYDFLIIGNKHLTSHSVERINNYKSEPEFKICVKRNL